MKTLLKLSLIICCICLFACASDSSTEENTSNGQAAETSSEAKTIELSPKATKELKSIQKDLGEASKQVRLKSKEVNSALNNLLKDFN